VEEDEQEAGFQRRRESVRVVSSDCIDLLSVGAAWMTVPAANFFCATERPTCLRAISKHGAIEDLRKHDDPYR